jgi:hypothetical protein
MKWVILGVIDNETIYGKIEDDGLMKTTCIIDHPELQSWIGKGNNPEPADTQE